MRYLIWDSIVVIVLINNIENPSLIGPLNQAPQADEEKWSVYFIESIFLKHVYGSDQPKYGAEIINVLLFLVNLFCYQIIKSGFEIPYFQWPMQRWAISTIGIMSVVTTMGLFSVVNLCGKSKHNLCF